MIAFPCTTFSAARFFEHGRLRENPYLGTSGGPPVIRSYTYPDGLPAGLIDPKHVPELKASNALLERTVNIAIAAATSSARSSVILENPADRSEAGDEICRDPDFKDHGSMFRTKAFRRLLAAVNLAHVTFAYCRLGSPYQKYTTLYFTGDVASELSALGGPEYKCNHSRGEHEEKVGGQREDGSYASARAAAYPAQLVIKLARAFDRARRSMAPAAGEAGTSHAAPPSRPDWQHDASTPAFSAPTPPTPAASGAAEGPARVPASAVPYAAASLPASPFSGGGTATGAYVPFGESAAAPPSLSAFPDLSEIDVSIPDRQVGGVPPPDGEAGGVPPSLRAADSRNASHPWRLAGAADPIAAGPRRAGSRAQASARFEPIPEEHDLEHGTLAEQMEHHAAVAAHAAAAHDLDVGDWLPLTGWTDVEASTVPTGSIRLPGGRRALMVEYVADAEPQVALLASLQHALRADSPDAPSSHSEAVRRGEIWIQAELGEMGNHAKNKSWTLIPRSEVPNGRKLHRLLWVYKMKRDGTAKARLCVDGSTLESGIDYDQVFSAALKYTSARGLFALAARKGCGVHSVDLVAAYLQGAFLDGEVVYCHQPQGHSTSGPNGEQLVARVEKPIYGIQQAGRRLQRLLFDWMRARGLRQLDDSDPCVWVLDDAPDGEIFVVGIYVDNLQIVHSVPLDSDHKAPSGSFYAKFMAQLSSDWDVVDEGPMDDLLGIEVRRNNDGSITLHQTKYIEKIVARFLPDGVPTTVQRSTLPFADDFEKVIADALASDVGLHPHLVRPVQERVGCLMYACTSTRPDIAFVTHKLCQCLQKPKPAVLAAVDRVIAYLGRHASVGLTYTKDYAALAGHADASWETRNSTSGWVVHWQSAAVYWGSRKQHSVALSSCEAEIIALSEAAKDVIYLRKFLKGIDGALVDGPTSLATDSQSARDVSYNPQHHDRMKHVARRHFFIRDMVESFEITVPFVRTHDNIADFLTKGMKSAPAWFAFRASIMNERDVLAAIAAKAAGGKAAAPAAAAGAK